MNNVTYNLHYFEGQKASKFIPSRNNDKHALIFISSFVLTGWWFLIAFKFSYDYFRSVFWHWYMSCVRSSLWTVWGWIQVWDQWWNSFLQVKYKPTVTHWNRSRIRNKIIYSCPVSLTILPAYSWYLIQMKHIGYKAVIASCYCFTITVNYLHVLEEWVKFVFFINTSDSPHFTQHATYDTFVPPLEQNPYFHIILDHSYVSMLLLYLLYVVSNVELIYLADDIYWCKWSVIKHVLILLCQSSQVFVVRYL